MPSCSQKAEYVAARQYKYGEGDEFFFYCHEHAPWDAMRLSPHMRKKHKQNFGENCLYDPPSCGDSCYFGGCS